MKVLIPTINFQGLWLVFWGEFDETVAENYLGMVVITGLAIFITGFLFVES